MEMTISEITIKPAPDSLLLPQDQRKLHPLQESDANSSVSTVEIVNFHDILQAALRPSNNSAT